MATQIANQEIRGEALESLAGVLADHGDLAQAKRTAEEALTVAQASGDKTTETTALVYLSQVLAAQGALKEGQSIAQQAITNADALAAKSLQAGSRILLGLILMKQGDTTKARENYKQALALEESADAGMEQKETHYLLGELAIEENRTSDANEMLQLLREDLGRRHDIDTELECLILQSELDFSTTRMTPPSRLLREPRRSPCRVSGSNCNCQPLWWWPNPPQRQGTGHKPIE